MSSDPDAVGKLGELQLSSILLGPLEFLEAVDEHAWCYASTRATSD